MKVHELIKQLKEFPPDYDVVIASDEEGNNFHSAYDLGLGWYDDDREFSSHVLDDEDDEYTERARNIDESNAVCIWP